MQSAQWQAGDQTGGVDGIARVIHPRGLGTAGALYGVTEVPTMFPSALAMPAPIPFVFDLTFTFGPVLLLIVLAVLDLSAVAVLHAALVANRRRIAGSSTATGPMVIPLRTARPETRQAVPPSRAA